MSRMKWPLMVTRGWLGLVVVAMMFLLPGMAAHAQSGETVFLQLEGVV